MIIFLELPYCAGSEKGGSAIIERTTAPSPTGPWTRGEPVLRPGGSGEWDEGLIQPVSVNATAEGYVMYYYGCKPGCPAMSGVFGMATSPDGITWQKYDDPSTTESPYAESDPVLQVGSPGSFDSGWILTASIRQTESGWELFYIGFNLSSSGKVGYATSPDGIHWTKYAGNPILERYFAVTSVFVNGDTYSLYGGARLRSGHPTVMNLMTGTINK